MPTQQRSFRIIEMGPGATFVECDVHGARTIAAAAAATFPECFSHAAEGGLLLRGVHAVTPEFVATALAASSDGHPSAQGAVTTLRVRYDGPDLNHVAQACGMSVAGVIEAHLSATYEVLFCGFAPGMSYLAGLDPRLRLPRRDNVRTQIPAGSLAIAAHYTAIYPSSSPGGWHLIGSCDEVLFHPECNPPVQLPPGTRVKFEHIR